MDCALCRGTQAFLGAIVGEFPGHQSKANTAINRVIWILWFPGACKKLCLHSTVGYEVWNSIMSKNQCTYLNYKRL